MDTETMLTTFDNPFNPFDDFIQWWLYDITMGYNSCGLLARIARSSEEFSTVEEKEENERAIEKIIDNDFLNIYTKVTRQIEVDDDEQ